jgi:ABC-type sulfate transport system permease subunit
LPLSNILYAISDILYAISNVLYAISNVLYAISNLSSYSLTNQNLFFTFSLLFISLICCSLQFPVVAREAAGYRRGARSILAAAPQWQ